MRVSPKRGCLRDRHTYFYDEDNDKVRKIDVSSRVESPNVHDGVPNLTYVQLENRAFSIAKIA